MNACGVDDLHDGANVIRTAVVIGTSKARETLEPFLGQLGRRLAHVLSRMLPISMYLLQKDGVHRPHSARCSVSACMCARVRAPPPPLLRRPLPDWPRPVPEARRRGVCGLYPAHRGGGARQVQGGPALHHSVHHLVVAHAQRLWASQYHRRRAHLSFCLFGASCGCAAMHLRSACAVSRAQSVRTACEGGVMLAAAAAMPSSRGVQVVTTGDENMPAVMARSGAAAAGGAGAAHRASLHSNALVTHPITDVLDGTLWNRELGAASEDIVATLVAQLFSGIRDYIVQVRPATHALHACSPRHAAGAPFPTCCCLPVRGICDYIAQARPPPRMPCMHALCPCVASTTTSRNRGSSHPSLLLRPRAWHLLRVCPLASLVSLVPLVSRQRSHSVCRQRR
jgi:hypothetical protein